jgi:hypothetical protein
MEARRKGVRAPSGANFKGEPMKVRFLSTAAGLAVAAALAVATPAHAAAYDYTNPSTTGCSSTGVAANGTASRVPIYNPEISGDVLGYVELRWSTACHTNWSRVTISGGAVNGAPSAGVMTWATRPIDGASTWGHDGDPGPYGGSSAFSDQLNGNGMTVCAYGRLAYQSINGPISWAEARYCY